MSSTVHTPNPATYLNRIKTARSNQPSLSSDEAYRQMEQVMATKIRRIKPSISAVSKVKARELGVLYEGLLPVVGSGREHDITYEARSGTCLKFTKPAKAAYVTSFDLGYARR